MSLTLLSGVPGVGLSSIAQEARKRLDEYQLINFGDVMLEEAAVQDLATSRDELSELSRRQTLRLQRRAGEYVADHSTGKNVLLTTHLAVATGSGYLLGLPDDVLRDVSPDGFVLVEASVETILDRRAESSRDYGDTSTVTVEFEQDLNRAAAIQYAATIDVPIQLVENEGDREDAAADLVDTL
ncbi:MAG: adenylate kinase [Halanaeroarchaeum sp.]